MLRSSDLDGHQCEFIPYDGRRLSDANAKTLEEVRKTVHGIMVEVCPWCGDLRFSPGSGPNKMMHPGQLMVK
jgi:hypothetical protein